MKRINKILLVAVCMVILLCIASHLASGYVLRCIDDELFVFIFKEKYDGNRWAMSINNNRLCTIIPLEGFSKREMREIIYESLGVICSNNEVKVFLFTVPTYEFADANILVYTVDGDEYFVWNEDVRSTKVSAQTRLNVLYENIDIEVLQQYVIKKAN